MRYELSDYEWGVIRPMLRTSHTALAANYLAFVKLASIRLWLRAYESTP
jgi:transposase